MPTFMSYWSDKKIFPFSADRTTPATQKTFPFGNTCPQFISHDNGHLMAPRKQKRKNKEAEMKKKERREKGQVCV